MIPKEVNNREEYCFEPQKPNDRQDYYIDVDITDKVTKASS